MVGVGVAKPELVPEFCGGRNPCGCVSGIGVVDEMGAGAGVRVLLPVVDVPGEYEYGLGALPVGWGVEDCGTVD